MAAAFMALMVPKNVWQYSRPIPPPKKSASYIGLKVTEYFVFGEAPAYVVRSHSLYGVVH